jgi:hypothetical protein
MAQNGSRSRDWDGIVDLYGVLSCGRLLNERWGSPDMLAMGQDVILGASSLLDDRAPHPACRAGEYSRPCRFLR